MHFFGLLHGLAEVDEWVFGGVADLGEIQSLGDGQERLLWPILMFYD